MNQKRTGTLILMALVLLAVFFPHISATNETNATPMGWVGEFDEWAGQKDMSQYNPVVPTVTRKRMDEETARTYPGVVVIDPDITFPPVKSIVYTNASTITTVDLEPFYGMEKPGTSATHPLDPDRGNGTDAGERSFFPISDIFAGIQDFFKAWGF